MLIEFCQRASIKSDPHPLRGDYLNSLIESQEMFLELQIRAASVFDILLDQVCVGYVVIDATRRLLEFYVTPTTVPVSEVILGQLVSTKRVTSAYVKSFDALTLAAAVAAHKKVTVAGYLFRDRAGEPEIQLPEGVFARMATADDVNDVAAINEEVFETQAEIVEYVEQEQTMLFFRERSLLGFAIFARVVEERPEFDVGMLVAAAHRRQGLGSAFLAHVATVVEKNGGRPTMGCAADNLGSRASIHKLGYYSRYRMLDFEF